ncbi:hypothetical protein [Halegenticoccus soli]|uniref:hypothetical protein n=1 Tax=Halegenticoccus soli TaxID=1985678 RepID=UPI0018EA5436|nr:hypothetical protein [Halegenticoccus soli]
MEEATLSEVEGETFDQVHYLELREAIESSFEEAVLKAIRDNSYPLPDKVQHIIYDGNEPVAKPDFFYKSRGPPIAVFVDGPDHEKTT